MLTALVLGGASGVWTDAETAIDLFTPDLVIAVNDIGTRWAGRLTHWVTLHPEHMSRWRAQRDARGYKPAQTHIGHELKDGIDRASDYRWPGMNASGSSGLFAVKVALDEGCDRVVLAGVPMQRAQCHFFSEAQWTDRDSFTQAWELMLPHLKDKVRSCSGWTQELLGVPTPAWLRG
jgi:hypothetical protein